MKCSELQFDLTLHVDGSLSDEKGSAIRDHLSVCPICRQSYSEIREIETSMGQLSRPIIPNALQVQLKRSVRSEIRRNKQAWISVSDDLRDWLQTRLMPYGVGVMATLVVGLTMLTTMFSGIRDTQGGLASSQSVYHIDKTILASSRDPFQGAGDIISPTDYASTRINVSSESPSVNPQGALIALTRSFVRGGMKDDEVVVVADVFGNGLAKISEVIEPSRDSHAVNELQKALNTDPAYAPFVPANMDKRSESVRVVLRFQSVDVSTGNRRRRR